MIFFSVWAYNSLFNTPTLAFPIPPLSFLNWAWDRDKTYLKFFSFKQKPSSTKIGLYKLRKTWFLDIKQGDDKKGMLTVQSLRNTLMATILTASIAILVNLSLAALTNNTYNASHLFNTEIFGSQSSRVYALKHGSASLFLLVSFLCRSMALGYLIDANFLINASAGDQFSSDPAYTQTIFERGFGLALIGNRVLCITFPMLLWMFGPLPVALSSAALVWGFYELDFAAGLKIIDRSLIYLDSSGTLIID